MEDFIFKYSNVPKRFVKDFFDMTCKYKYGEKYVDIDVVSKWLKHDADKIKEIVVDKFDSEVEYIAIDDESKNSFKVSTNIFKELCVILGTDKAKQMRKYYMSIEKIINNYDGTGQTNILDISNCVKDFEKEKEKQETMDYISSIITIIYFIIMLVYIYLQFKK